MDNVNLLKLFQKRLDNGKMRYIVFDNSNSTTYVYGIDDIWPFKLCINPNSYNSIDEISIDRYADMNEYLLVAKVDSDLSIKNRIVFIDNISKNDKIIFKDNINTMIDKSLNLSNTNKYIMNTISIISTILKKI